MIASAALPPIVSPLTARSLLTPSAASFPSPLASSFQQPTPSTTLEQTPDLPATKSFIPTSSPLTHAPNITNAPTLPAPHHRSPSYADKPVESIDSLSSPTTPSLSPLSPASGPEPSALATAEKDKVIQDKVNAAIQQHHDLMSRLKARDTMKGIVIEVDKQKLQENPAALTAPTEYVSYMDHPKRKKTLLAIQDYLDKGPFFYNPDDHPVPFRRIRSLEDEEDLHPIGECDRKHYVRRTELTVGELRAVCRVLIRRGGRTAFRAMIWEAAVSDYQGHEIIGILYVGATERTAHERSVEDYCKAFSSRASQTFNTLFVKELHAIRQRATDVDANHSEETASDETANDECADYENVEDDDFEPDIDGGEVKPEDREPIWVLVEVQDKGRDRRTGYPANWYSEEFWISMIGGVATGKIDGPRLIASNLTLREALRTDAPLTPGSLEGQQREVVTKSTIHAAKYFREQLDTDIPCHAVLAAISASTNLTLLPYGRVSHVTLGKDVTQRVAAGNADIHDPFSGSGVSWMFRTMVEVLYPQTSGQILATITADRLARLSGSFMDIWVFGCQANDIYPLLARVIIILEVIHPEHVLMWGLPVGYLAQRGYFGTKDMAPVQAYLLNPTYRNFWRVVAHMKRLHPDLDQCNLLKSQGPSAEKQLSVTPIAVGGGSSVGWFWKHPGVHPKLSSLEQPLSEEVSYCQAAHFGAAVRLTVDKGTLIHEVNKHPVSTVIRQAVMRLVRDRGLRSTMRSECGLFNASDSIVGYCRLRSPELQRMWFAVRKYWAMDPASGQGSWKKNLEMRRMQFAVRKYWALETAPVRPSSKEGLSNASCPYLVLPISEDLEVDTLEAPGLSPPVLIWQDASSTLHEVIIGEWEDVGDLACRALDSQIKKHEEAMREQELRVATSDLSLFESAAAKIANILGDDPEAELRAIDSLPLPIISRAFGEGWDRLPYTAFCAARSKDFGNDAGPSPFQSVDPDEWILQNERVLRDEKKRNWSWGLVNMFANADVVLPTSDSSANARNIHRPNLSGRMLLDQRRLPILPIQPSLEKYLAAFDHLTGGLLKNLNWDHVFVAGGMPLSTLLCTDLEEDAEKYKDSDIDMYIYGLDPVAANQKVDHIYQTWLANLPPNSQPHVLRNSRTITFLATYPIKRIQIVLKLVASPKEVLLNFDLDQCAVGFDGKEVWMLPRAARALETGYSVFTMDIVHGHYLGDRRASQDHRIIKYADKCAIRLILVPKGFGIRFLPSYLESLNTHVDGITRKTWSTRRHQRLFQLEDVLQRAREWTERLVDVRYKHSYRGPHTYKVAPEDISDRKVQSSEPLGRSALQNLEQFARLTTLWEAAVRKDIILLPKRDAWEDYTDAQSPIGYDEGPHYSWDASATFERLQDAIKKVHREELWQYASNLESYGVDIPELENRWNATDTLVAKAFVNHKQRIQRMKLSETLEGVMGPEGHSEIPLHLPEAVISKCNELIGSALRDHNLPYSEPSITPALNREKMAEITSTFHEDLTPVIWRIDSIRRWQLIDRRIDEAYEILWAFRAANAVLQSELVERTHYLVTQLSKRAIRSKPEDEYASFAHWVTQPPLKIGFSYGTWYDTPSFDDPDEDSERKW
ncbi:hypothetical protein DL93DRAFT_2094740 [Clavulina sp. PMI_390]|nr:hypothetical protein DL93DRAFT_2094740 [Clavulina sp. PMI_390]